VVAKCIAAGLVGGVAHFVLELHSDRGAAGIHGLRSILKALLRRHGYRCLSAIEVQPVGKARKATGESSPVAMSPDRFAK
jgi:hypothetical protein